MGSQAPALDARVAQGDGVGTHEPGQAVRPGSLGGLDGGKEKQ